MSAGATANFVPEFERIAAGLPGSARVLERRRAAMARFAAAGFPTQREEAWKYTNVVPLSRRAFTVNLGVPAFDPTRLAALPIQRWEGVECVFVDGQYRPELSSLEKLAGLDIQSLSQIIARDVAFADRVTGLGEDECSGLVALNAAFTADGVVINIADGKELTTPVRLLFVMTANTVQACFPRVLIHAGRGARARIVEHYVGEPGANGFTNAVTQLAVDDGAKVTHYRVQDESDGAHHIGSLFVQQARGGEVISHSLSLGARMTRIDINVKLNAPDAAVTLNGLYLTQGRQHVDHHTRVDHFHPHTRSEQTYNGILSGAGRGVFNGKVVVHPHAVKTDAQQSNRNLLLSSQAEIDTKPELEIYADDVKCAHGATVGQLSEDALFYLRARGIDEIDARNMLTCAFAAEILDRVDIESLRRGFADRIAGLLPENPAPPEGL